MRLKRGVDWELEEIADSLILESRRDVKSLDEKKDILLPHQIRRRMEKETYTHLGVPDASLFSGIYKRVYNGKASRKQKLKAQADYDGGSESSSW